MTSSDLRIILSPAKKMVTDRDTFPVDGLPEFLADARRLWAHIRGLSYAEAKALWNCSDSLAELNRERFIHMDLDQGLTPALIAYEGIQYQYLSPKTLEEDALSWLSEHLYILSGFYGILRPFEGVAPYRLEMQAALELEGSRNLYEFWGDRIYRSLLWDRRENTVILNLASREYAKAVEPYLKPEDRFVTCVFAEEQDGKLRQKATLAKMARGEMTRWLAQEQADSLETVKSFTGLGFAFSEARSDGQTLVFLRPARRS